MPSSTNQIPWRPIATIGVIAGVVGAALRLSRHANRPSKRVALIGDSYAVGLGPELAKTLHDFKFEGHVGTNTAQWAYRSEACVSCGSWLSSFKPDLVLISLGVNDGTAPKSENYQQIVRSVHGIGANVIWIEPPAGVSAPATRAAIASLGVKTAPATHVPLSGDKLHPASYVDWAREIAQTVSRA